MLKTEDGNSNAHDVRLKLMLNISYAFLTYGKLMRTFLLYLHFTMRKQNIPRIKTYVKGHTILIL